jgi:threonine dehydratase
VSDVSDLSADAIRAATGVIDPVFRDTPQLADEQLSAALGRYLVVKVETLTPVGSFKGRGASVLVRELDAQATWVLETAGNFGQAIAYLARQRGTRGEIFVSPEVPPVKVARMRALGAVVEVCAEPAAAAAEAAAREGHALVVDGQSPAMAEGAGTIGLELAAVDPFDTVVVQVGDGALAAGVACAVKSVYPATRVVGVCASGAPSMAESFSSRRAMQVEGAGTIATALAITDPLPEALARLLVYVDEIVVVDDDDLRQAMRLIADTLGLLVEPAGAAGIAALARRRERIDGDRIAAILTGSAGHPSFGEVVVT